MLVSYCIIKIFWVQLEVILAWGTGRTAQQSDNNIW